MTFKIREYEDKDYNRCADLVCRAWDFESVFQPSGFTELAKSIYTGGALIESTFKSVAVVNEEVVGFIFGINRTKHRFRLHLKFRSSVIWKAYRIKHCTPSKRDLIQALSMHESNRSALVPKKRSEIALFVVADSCQGKGIGKALWDSFLESCKKLNESRVYVETNKMGASGFYEKLGFSHVSDFDSPLHRIATPNGVACIYVYDCDN